MNTKVYVLGGTQTDFSRNWAREGLDIYSMFSETVEQGLTAASLEAKDIDVAHVGNFVSAMFTGQAQLGGFFGHVHPDFSGMPTSRHEAACASGSMALLAAMRDIESGHYGVACVLGLEMMRNVEGATAADHLAAAGWRGQEGLDCNYMWPSMFSKVVDEYDRRYGVNSQHLSRIAEINFGNALANPNAQTRKWTLNPENFSDDDQANPIVEGRLRKQDCGQITDGAAVVFLAGEQQAKEYAKARGLPFDKMPYIKGWGHRTAAMSLAKKLADSHDDALVFPHVKHTFDDALQRASIAGIDGLDALEIHDCFTATEYMVIDHCGLTAPGESWKAIENDDIAMGGKLPINPSGGLIGLGHPVGATGVRMMLDAYKQVSGSAGDYQVEGASNIGIFNLGGSATTCATFVVGN